MPGWFIFAILLWVLALIALAVVVFVPRAGRVYGLGAAVLLVVFGVISSLIASYDRVDTRNVGIITSFGKPVGEHGAGIVWHAPWEKVSELSEAIQLQAFEGNTFDDHGTAVQVRLANNSTAFVDENLNWRLRAGAAPQLFQDYGGSTSDVFGNIKLNLVDRQAQVALSKVFANFNPVTAMASQNCIPGTGTPPGPAGTPANCQPGAVPTPAQGADLPGMANQVKKDLQEAVGQDIEILDVRIPRIFYDKPTQDRIDAYNQKVQETLNAQQDVKTAEQQRLASEQRANQPPPDLRIAIFNCVQKATEDHRDAAGCWGQIGGTPLIQMPKPGP